MKTIHSQKTSKLHKRTSINSALLAVAAFFVSLAGLVALPQAIVEAACATTGQYGSATMSVQVPASGTYRLWVRLQAPDTTNNSVLVDVGDTNCGIKVGDNTSIPANTWKWLDYKDGSTTNKVNLSLSQGTQTVRLLGNEPSVKIDKILLLSDLNCVPADNKFGEDCTNPTTGDTTAPTVSVTSPTNGSTVTGVVNVTATAADNVGVTKVEFYAGTTLVGADTTSPYSVSWDTTQVANGSYSLTAKAFDAANNNTNSSAVSVNVSNSTTPTGTFTYDGLVDGQTVSGNIAVQVFPQNVSDFGRFQFFLDSSATPHNEERNAPYCFNGDNAIACTPYDTNQFTNGAHSLNIKLLSSGSQLIDQKTINFTVNNDTTAPQVSITNPANGATINSVVDVTTNVSDNVKVTRVDFSIDGTVVKSDSGPNSFHHLWDTSSVNDGQHTVSARAFDAAGNSTTTTISVNVANNVDNVLPTVEITSPVGGSTVSSTVPISVNASDNTGVTKVDFFANGASLGSDTSAPYSASWNTTTLPNGSYVVTVRAYDAAGNIGTTSETYLVQNGDTQAPSTPTGVTATASAHNQVNVSWAASTDNVGVTGYYIIRDGVTIAQVNTTGYTDNTVSGSQTYRYQVQATDAAGNLSAQSLVSSVTTPAAPDNQAPSAPGNLTITSVTSDQINLSWQASNDNVGIVAYDIYRDGTLVQSISGTSYGDGTVSAGNSYTYYVKARDAAGNVSAASNSVSTTTPEAVTTGSIWGVVTDTSTAQGITAARVDMALGPNRASFSTDSSGTYAFTQLSPATYRVSADATGYKFIKNVSVTVTAGNISVQNFELQNR